MDSDSSLEKITLEFRLPNSDSRVGNVSLGVRFRSWLPHPFVRIVMLGGKRGECGDRRLSPVFTSFEKRRAPNWPIRNEATALGGYEPVNINDTISSQRLDVAVRQNSLDVGNRYSICLSEALE